MINNPFMFVKFLIVGVINTIIGLSFMFLCLHFFRLSYWLSTFFGNGLGAAFSYLLNRKFTFQSEVRHRKGVFRFIIVILISYIFAYQFSYKFTGWLFSNTDSFNFTNIDDIAILVGSAVYTVTNYFGQKLFVFNNKAIARTS